MSAKAVKFPAAAMIDWFGANADTDATLRANLLLMDEIIKDNQRTVTFVQGSRIDLRVAYNPENALQPAVLENPTKPTVFDKPVIEPARAPTANAGGFFGFAFPMNAGKESESRTRGHVGSGFRIYLGKEYFSTASNSMDRPQTVYHELTHKVLATNDHEYGAAGCRALAISDPAKAKKNADSYGYFVTSMNGYVWP